MLWRFQSVTRATHGRENAMMRTRNVAYAALVFAGAAVMVAPRAAAEMQVIESNSPQYKVGMTLPDDAKLDLGTGERVKVLLLPSMQTKVFAGKSGPQPGVTGGARGIPKGQ
jgi:hypothetical protein